MGNRTERNEFNQGYARLLIYQREYTNMDVPKGYVTPDGYALGAWAENIRKKWQKGELAEYQIARLGRVGFCKEKVHQNWEYMYHLVKEYREQNGSYLIPVNYCTEDGVLLGAWLSRQKRFFCLFDEAQKQKLMALEMEGKK